MQANCPSCTNKIFIDDARVPERAFSVKCPKCSTVVKFPGRTPAAAAAPVAATPAAGPEPESLGGVDAEQLRVQMMAQIRREIGTEGAKDRGRALIALSDRTISGAITLPLTRQGFHVDTMDNPDEGGRLLDQGVYDLVVTARVAGTGGHESLYQRLNRLSPDARRRVFVILVGDEFKSGEGIQAFVCMADLVVHSREAATCDSLLVNTLAERERLYRAYVDARARHEAAAAV